MEYETHTTRELVLEVLKELNNIKKLLEDQDSRLDKRDAFKAASAPMVRRNVIGAPAKAAEHL